MSAAEDGSVDAGEGSDSWDDAVDDQEEADRQQRVQTAGDGAVTALTTAIDGSVSARVAYLLAQPCCTKNCFFGKEEDLTAFLQSMEAMNKRERASSLLTALSLASAIGSEHAKHMRKERGKIRERFQYYLPLLGAVCKTAFMNCYHISQNTMSRYRSRARQRDIFPAPHGGKKNQNAHVLNEKHLVAWFRKFASEVGRPVSLEMDASLASMTTASPSYTLLPSLFTWEGLLEQYQQFVKSTKAEVRVPSVKSFQHYLKKECRHVCIQTGTSDNICAQCTIYHATRLPTTSTTETETFVEHIYYAKIMRKEYYKDLASANPQHLVVSMDFAEEFALPMTPAMHSLWPFRSLVGVHMFGVYCANDKQQYNFLYTERLGERGWNEGVSLLHTALELKGLCKDVLGPGTGAPGSAGALGVRKVTVWADNTDGEGKTSTVIWYLAFLVETGILDEANLNFLVKGHTQNTCHHSFRAAQRQVVEEELWTLSHLADEVERATNDTRAINVATFGKPFRDYRSFLKSRYKKLKEIDTYQMFRMTRDQPGIVMCRRKPTSDPVLVDLKKRRTSLDVSGASFLEQWTQIRKLPKPEPKHEKLSDFFEQIVPSVPVEYRSDELYEKPSSETEEIARSIKRARTSMG
ncbi:hypothetical protein BBJ28_00001782 [Nothophytophthora sp. Chile5]|nr:hypothetical protein BBJ28_00001782 [Nothophytophthora sp. Chile5]